MKTLDEIVKELDLKNKIYFLENLYLWNISTKEVIEKLITK